MKIFRRRNKSKPENEDKKRQEKRRRKDTQHTKDDDSKKKRRRNKWKKRILKWLKFGAKGTAMVLALPVIAAVAAVAIAGSIPVGLAVLVWNALEYVVVLYLFWVMARALDQWMIDYNRRPRRQSRW